MKKRVQTETKKRPMMFFYAGLWLVILIWSTTPVVDPYIYEYFSPTFTSTVAGLASVLSLMPIVATKFSKINKNLLTIAIPTGIINAVASIAQKIGLLYTTPSKYAFLENLSCVVVPILMYLFIRKKPSALKITASVICLVGCFVLSGAKLGDWNGFGIGEILCAFAGALYGVTIAVTGAFATKIYAPLYVWIHMIITTVTGICSSFALHNIHFNGSPISPFYIKWNWGCLAVLVVIAILSNSVCWIIRTNVLKHLDASVVAVMMPFSAVLTGILSMITGQDTLSVSLAVGALLILLASILSGLGDVREAHASKHTEDMHITDT